MKGKCPYCENIIDEVEFMQNEGSCNHCCEKKEIFDLNGDIIEFLINLDDLDKKISKLVIKFEKTHDLNSKEINQLKNYTYNKVIPSIPDKPIRNNMLKDLEKTKKKNEIISLLKKTQISILSIERNTIIKINEVINEQMEL